MKERKAISEENSNRIAEIKCIKKGTYRFEVI